MRSLLLAIVAMLIIGCGSSEGVGSDGGMCLISVQFEPFDAIAPATITARSTVGGASGVLTYSWSVSHGGQSVTITPRTPDRRDIDFVADLPGIYDVELDVTGCNPFVGSVNVRDPGQSNHGLRMRFAPTPAINVPIQERVINISGGADYAAGVLAIDPGTAMPIAVRDELGAQVATYVRLRSRSTPDVTIELVAAGPSDVAPALVPGRYDVLLVPLVTGLAPATIDNWDPATDPLVVDGGTAMSGVVVVGPTSTPVAGAKVLIATADTAAPSTIATTGADGSFVLRWRPSPGATLVVAPPLTTGLPRLRGSLATLNPSAAITARYNVLPTVDLTGRPARIGGASVGAGHVLFALELGAAGTISDGVASVVATGSHRDQVATDAAGNLTSYRVSAVSGRAFVVGATGPGGVAVVDLATATSIDAAAPVAITATVVNTSGAAIVGATLTAAVAGDLAHLSAPRVSGTADSSGHVTMTVAGGANYDLIVDDPRSASAPQQRTFAGVAGDLGMIALPRAIRIQGELRVVGSTSGLSSASVSALCTLCTGLDRSRPMGQAVTDAGGRFSVVIPDPGAAQ